MLSDVLPSSLRTRIRDLVLSGAYNFEALYILRNLMGYVDELKTVIGGDDVMTIDLVTSELSFKEFPGPDGLLLLTNDEIAEKVKRLSRYMNECDVMGILERIVSCGDT